MTQLHRELQHAKTTGDLRYSYSNEPYTSNLKWKSSKDVATSALSNEIVLEVKCRGRSFELNQSVIDAHASFWFLFQTTMNPQSKSEYRRSQNLTSTSLHEYEVNVFSATFLVHKKCVFAFKLVLV